MKRIKTKMLGVRETAYTTLNRPQLEYDAAIWDPTVMTKPAILRKSNDELNVGQLAALIEGPVSQT